MLSSGHGHGSRTGQSVCVERGATICGLLPSGVVACGTTRSSIFVRRLLAAKSNRVVRFPASFAGVRGISFPLGATRHAGFMQQVIKRESVFPARCGGWEANDDCVTLPAGDGGSKRRSTERLPNHGIQSFNRSARSSASLCGQLLSKRRNACCRP